MHTDYYDYIIIGTGISGLYSAYLIKKKNPTSSILILDKEKKEWIGGRTQNEEFYNTTIVTGAGVARKNKDKLLFKLINELNINNIHESIAQTNFANTIKHPVNILKIINELKKHYNKLKIKPNITFKEFAKPILGKDLYKYFTICTGYTDYEKEDVYEVLFNYGMDDNIPGWKLIMVPWKELILKLVNFIGSNNIKSLHNVIEIKITEDTNKLIMRSDRLPTSTTENKVDSSYGGNSSFALHTNQYFTAYLLDKNGLSFAVGGTPRTPIGFASGGQDDVEENFATNALATTTCDGLIPLNCYTTNNNTIGIEAKNDQCFYNGVGTLPTDRIMRGGCYVLVTRVMETLLKDLNK